MAIPRTIRVGFMTIPVIAALTLLSACAPTANSSAQPSERSAGMLDVRVCVHNAMSMPVKVTWPTADHTDPLTNGMLAPTASTCASGFSTVKHDDVTVRLTWYTKLSQELTFFNAFAQVPQVRVDEEYGRTAAEMCGADVNELWVFAKICSDEYEVGHWGQYIAQNRHKTIVSRAQDSNNYKQFKVEVVG